MKNKPLKILVTGANGQLGNELQTLAINAKHEFVFTDVAELDITNITQVQRFFDLENFQYCINCAAYTQVDKAESDEALAYKINELGAKNLAIACEKHGATMFQVSTDFVFGGEAFKPLSENAPTAPQGVYAASKLAGEMAVAKECSKYFTIRTAWLYSSFGGNFVKTMRKLGREREHLTIIADQIGSPTYARDLAEVILHIITHIEGLNEDKKLSTYGTYHYSNEGVASWYDFAVAVMELSNIHTRVLPIPTEAYPTPAKRPHYSLMDKAKIKSVFSLEIPHWRKSLTNCIALLDNTSAHNLTGKSLKN
jgi:dTDP-4-dehydrorhamnose reductase